MKRNIRIHSAVYEKPLETAAIVDISEGSFRASWAERSPEGDVSSYRLELDRESGIVTLVRSGQVSSKLIFDTAAETEGAVGTPFGTFDVRIRTEYINMPSVFDNCFSIKYVLYTGDQGEANLFKIELL